MDKYLLPTVLSDLGQHSLAAAGNTTQLQDPLLKATLPALQNQQLQPNTQALAGQR